MRALTIKPGDNPDPRIDDVDEPDESLGPVLVQGLAVGICGTDREILAGGYGEAPPGRERLVLGHESLGRVLDPGGAEGLAEGDLVAGIVRRRDPEPCPACARGEWDFCHNGRYTEHGIKGVDGFASERWRVEADHAVKIDVEVGDLGVLLEPASVVAKAWEQVDRVGSRGAWEPATALITGAGPIGLLAALIGVERGLDVHVLDRVEGGPKAELIADLGATYHCGDVNDIGVGIDVVIECTGAAPVIMAAMTTPRVNGVICLTGVGGGRKLTVDAAAVGRELVLENSVVVGSVNANRRHWQAGAEALARADREWLSRLITRRVALDDFAEALELRDGDIKVVLDIASA